MPAGRCRGASPCWRSAASSAGRRLALPAGAISETIGELSCAVVSDPDGPGQRALIERAITEAGARAGLGTTVDWTPGRDQLRAAPGLRWSSPASRPELVVARERAGELLLRSDPRLAGELAADRLAPLASLSPGSRRG